MNFKYIVVSEITQTSSILALSDQGQDHGTTLTLFSIYCDTNFEVPLLNFGTSEGANIKHVCLSDNNIQIL